MRDPDSAQERSGLVNEIKNHNPRNEYSSCCRIVLMVLYILPWCLYVQEKLHSRTLQNIQAALHDTLVANQELSTAVRHKLALEATPCKRPGNGNVDRPVEAEVEKDSTQQTEIAKVPVWPEAWGAYPDASGEFHIFTAACSRVKRCPEVIKLSESLKRFGGDARFNYHVVYDEICKETMQNLESSDNFTVTLHWMDDIIKDVLEKRPNLMRFIKDTRYHGSKCAAVYLWALESHEFADVDHILHLDGDTLVVDEMEDALSQMWKQMVRGKFSIGMVPESYDGGWYAPYNYHVGEYGVNSGVSFLNYGLMRQRNFIDSLLESNSQCKDAEGKPCEWLMPEQDMLNYYYSEVEPAQILVLPCIWNFRINFRTFCCERPLVMHGANFVFYKENEWKEILSLDDKERIGELADGVGHCKA